MSEITSDAPVTLIRPAGRSGLPDFRELWRARDLALILAWRDVKVRYKQSLIGIAWAVLQPLLTMVVFTLIFGKFAQLPSQGLPYPVFSMLNLVPWTFLAAVFTLTAGCVLTEPDARAEGAFPAPHPAARLCARPARRLRVLVRRRARDHRVVRRFDPPDDRLGAGIPADARDDSDRARLVPRCDQRALSRRPVRVPFLVQLWLFASGVIYAQRRSREKYTRSPRSTRRSGRSPAFGGPWPARRRRRSATMLGRVADARRLLRRRARGSSGAPSRASRTRSMSARSSPKASRSATASASTGPGTNAARHARPRGAADAAPRARRPLARGALGAQGRLVRRSRRVRSSASSAATARGSRRCSRS